MKILIIADGFLPGQKYGGPVVSVDNFCSLMTDFDCYIVARNHDLGESIPYSGIREGWNHRGNCHVRYLSDKEYNTASFEAAIKETRPDWIYLQSMFQSCVIFCLALAKKYGIRVLLAPRGELCKGAFRKKYKKIPYLAVLHALGLLKNVDFQSTSDEETQAIAKYLWARDEKIHFLTNIPSMPSGQFAARKKNPGSAKLVFLSRLHPKKNLLGGIRCLRNVQGNVTLDIYGSKEDSAYWAECEAAIAALPKNVQVRYCGVVQHEQVHRIFNEYDALLFPTRSENYGHVIVEALLSGCPVILSDQTPWLDVYEYGAGWTLPLEQEQAFTDAVNTVVAWETVPEEQTRAYIAGKLDLVSLQKQYLAVFDRG